MAKLRRGHEFAKTRGIMLFGWLCGCEQYRGHEGEAGSDDALHFTVLPRDRRISIFSLKAKFVLTAHSSTHFSTVLGNVRVREQTGRHVLALSSSQFDPERSAPGSWQRIGGESPPRGRSSQPPRPRVMHEVLLARAAVKRSQGRPRAKYS